MALVRGHVDTQLIVQSHSDVELITDNIPRLLVNASELINLFSIYE